MKFVQFRAHTSRFYAVMSGIISNSTFQWKIADFNLGKPLGKGRFGNVYVAKEKKTSYVVALKIMFKKDIRDAELQHQVNLLSVSF